MRSRSGLPCDVCGLPTWVSRSSGQASARHKACKPETEHGTRIGYRERLCRCADCRAWQAQSFREYKHARREEGRPIPKRSWIAASVRLAVYERDEWTCQLCFDAIDRDADPNSDWAPSLDHIIPSSQGGSDGVENLRATHRWCNTVRSDGKHHADMFA